MSPVPNLLNPDVPLHHQIYVQVKAEIVDGIWVGRDDFPGEIELASKFGVSVITTRKALERLTSEGWIERGRGRRSRALRVPASDRREASPMMFPLGKPRPYAYKVLSSGTGHASAEACAAFGLPAGSKLWLCSRLRSFKRRPHSVTLNAQLPELGERHSPADLAKLPMSQILRVASCKPVSLRRRVGSGFAPAHVATHLEISIHDPVLIYTFAILEKGHRVIEWARIYVHPDEPAAEEVFDFVTGKWQISEPM